MKKSLPTFLLILALGTTFTFTSCASRFPKPKSAQGSISRYFKGYGKDFKETDFGKLKVDEVEISGMRELQHGLVRIEAYISLDEGNVVYKVGATMEKKTFRWKVVAWENLGKAS